MKLLSNTLAIIAAYLFMTAEHSFSDIRVTLTPSLPRGLYVASQEPLSRGVIVEECLPVQLAYFAKERGYIGRGKCPGNAVSLLKKVVGLPGDTIELGQKYVAVNDVYIPNSATEKTDTQGRDLFPVPRGKFVLKDDEVFLLGEHERSLDGRYFGPTKTKYLLGIFRPALTEREHGL